MKLSHVIIMTLLVTANTALPLLAGTMQVEKLDRGLIAVRKGSGYYLSWRHLADEPYNAGFNVYRETTKLNSTPITGATIYTDASAAQNSVYTVRAVVNGVEQVASPAALLINNTTGPNANDDRGETAGYIQINLQRPATGAQGGTYSPGDGSTGDLNGDGVYEIVLKWDPDNAKDNSQSGVTDNVLIDAYTLSGTRLWRIDLGQNIRAGAHYTQFLVYDFDGDGKAEVMMKTAPGTKDGTGAYIKMGPAANASHTTAYRNADGYVLSGPEYLTVFDGATGKELATVDYWPARGTVNSWGDNYGNRLDRYNATVAYVDGERPSAVFQRGYYTRMTFAVWDWRNGQLTQKWTFDSNASGNSAYAGQGNHQISVADANGDGKHDIITGPAVIGSDGKGMHVTGWGHGDALHVAHMIKGHPTPQIYMPHENKTTNGKSGVLLRQASNGTAVFSHPKDDTDVGRGCAAELDKNAPGFKFWAASGLGLYDLTGKVVGNVPSSINHIIWWDGDLTRALLDGYAINKWNISGNSATRLLTANGYGHINGTKSNPVLQADLFGDWREEVIFSNGTNAIRIYTTMMATTHRLVTLMHDPVYRVAVSWQNSSYNQPPHPGYYIASDMNFPPPALDVAVLGGTNPPPPPPPQIDGGVYIGSGIVIDSLILFDTANAQGWSIQRSDLAAGQKAYGDRDYQIVSISGFPLSVEWVRTSMGTRTLTSPDTIAKFKMKEGGEVFVAIEARVNPTPSWLSAAGFETKGVLIFILTNAETGESDTIVSQSRRIVVNDGQADRNFVVYSKTFEKGETVVLGINSNDGTTQSLMYLVAVEDKLMAGNPGGTSVLDRAKPASNYSMKISHAEKGGAFRVNYSIKEKGTVRLDLFDIKGHRVKTFVNSAKNAGAYSERVSTNRLASGVYIVMLRAGAQVLQARVLIAK